MLKYLSGFLSVFIVCVGCRNIKPESSTYFDSLVNSNIIYNTVNNGSLSKQTIVGEKKDSVTYKPDSLHWSNELDVFRQLSSFQRPAYRDDYTVTDGIKDSRSNLTIREYKATKAIPVTLIRFYYFRELKQLKKVEAEYLESNTLYSTTRHLIMDFDEKKNGSVLSRYSIEGMQQMILSNNESYQISGAIQY